MSAFSDFLLVDTLIDGAGLNISVAARFKASTALIAGSNPGQCKCVFKI